MLNARVLVVLFLIHPDQMKWVRVTPASKVDLCLSLLNWHRWMKLFEMKRNWRCSPMTFLMSFPNVLSKTMGWKDLGKLYDSLFSFGMTIVIEDLKCDGYQPISKHVLAIFMILPRQTLLLIINLRWHQESLLGPRTDKLLHFCDGLHKIFLRERWPFFGWFVMDFFKNIDVDLTILSIIKSWMKSISEIVDL